MNSAITLIENRIANFPSDGAAVGSYRASLEADIRALYPDVIDMAELNRLLDKVKAAYNKLDDSGGGSAPPPPRPKKYRP